MNNFKKLIQLTLLATSLATFAPANCMNNHYSASTFNNGYTIRVWDLSKKNDDDGYYRVLKGHTAYVNSIAFHPTKSNILVSASEDNTARIWDLNKEENDKDGYCTILNDHTYCVNAVAFSAPIVSKEKQAFFEKLKKQVSNKFSDITIKCKN